MLEVASSKWTFGANYKLMLPCRSILIVASSVVVFNSVVGSRFVNAHVRCKLMLPVSAEIVLIAACDSVVGKFAFSVGNKLILPPQKIFTVVSNSSDGRIFVSADPQKCQLQANVVREVVYKL